MPDRIMKYTGISVHETGGQILLQTLMSCAEFLIFCYFFNIFIKDEVIKNIILVVKYNYVLLQMKHRCTAYANKANMV